MAISGEKYTLFSEKQVVAEKLIETGIFFTKSDNNSTTRMGFEPTRETPID